MRNEGNYNLLCYEITTYKKTAKYQNLANSKEAEK
jgi:hypothetical protein